MILAQYICLLVAHWVADFVCQSHWQASNKSKSNAALGQHILTYTFILGMASILIFPGRWEVVSFTAINGVLHFATDYCTSRWSAVHFGKAIRAMNVVGEDAGPPWHDFFVIIGFDQLIHHLTLAATLWLLLAKPLAAS